MKTKIRVMGVSVLAFTLSVLSASAQTQEVSIQNNDWVVQVTGNAELEITPDEIYMSLTLKDGDVKGQTLSQIESHFISEIRSLGIDPDKALKVNSMLNAPRRRNSVDTSRTYELKVGDAATLKGVFYILGEMGVKDAKVTRMNHSGMDEYKMEVRIQAIKNAQQNAQALAKALGQSAGKAIFIQDNGNVMEISPLPVSTRSYKLMGVSGVDMYSESSGSETVLEFQDITLKYSVTAKFVLNWK